MRLDVYIAEKCACSRTKAVNMIADGSVTVNGRPATKPSRNVTDADDVAVSDEYRFASMGGYKLEKAFADFCLDVSGRTCADIGASNGGFTDCLLRHGAAKVYAVDVGACALDEKLKNDERIVVKDNVNARYLNVGILGEKVSFVTIDVSFISLKLVLPAAISVLTDNGEIVALIKPQFEAGRKNLSKSGIVVSEKVRNKVVDDIRDFATSLGAEVKGVTSAPVREGKNVEYLIRMTVRTTESRGQL